MTLREKFLNDITDFLLRTGLNPTQFGRAAAHDPNFVHELRRGRDVGFNLYEQVNTFMQNWEPPTGG